jgi:hypothetical protein
MTDATNPIVHQRPTVPMTPQQMHRVIRQPQHANCTLDDCEMKRDCWNRLRDLGHEHPDQDPDDCRTCKYLPK